MRYLVVAVILGICALCAEAQTETHPPSAAQSLSCLVKSADPPSFPKRNEVDKGFGAMRVLLKFTTADAAPAVEVLFNTARQDMQDTVYRYLRGYRLPCLTPKDGVVTAVQEFSFSNTDRDAAPLPPQRPEGGPPFCVVMPREDMLSPEIQPDKPEHVVVFATFNGDGQQPPEVKFLHASAPQRFMQAVRKRVEKYRMPCRKAGDEPQSLQQQFTLYPSGQDRYGFKREAFSLREFLGMVRRPRELKAHYDLNTMGCPFKVNYTLYGGNVPNEAVVRADKDPNKLPFLDWLASLELKLDADQANALFGSTLQINVGCGTIHLDGES